MSRIEELLEALGLEAGSATFNTSIIILSVALILFTGFMMTRLTKLLKLPNVTAYIISGILIGPSILNLVPKSFIVGTDFLSDIALAFIAFSAGEFFKISNLKKAGFKVIIITLSESLLAFALVFLVSNFILHIDTSFSLVLAALSSATAPASTMMTIKQTNAKGDYVNTLLEVVALDDVVTLILYSLAIAICLGINNQGSSLDFKEVILPIIYNLICLAIGFAFGFILRFLLPQKRTNDNRLIIVIAVIFLFCGICSLFGQSPLLGCMAIGVVYTNQKDNSERLFKQVNYFTPPIMLLFFVRSGMNFDLRNFISTDMVSLGVPLVLVSIIYFFVRIIGKYGGAFLSCLGCKTDKKIRNYLGLGLIPQAGVAIGLAAMGSRIFADNGQVELGIALNTIILASSILYELIGPGCAKLGLYLSKSYSNNLDEVVEVSNIDHKQNEVDKLIAQINEIRKELPELVNDEEEAFTDAAEEEEIETGRNRMRDFINRRR